MRGPGLDYGLPKSKAHRAAISAATKLRYTRVGEREKTSRAVKAGLPPDHSKGKRNPRYGVKLSDEIKKRISGGRKGKGLGNQNWRKRGPYTSEALLKMSEAAKRRWRDHPRP